MRHQRAKAARKTLQHFARTVNLQSKPYYSVLLDATFLIAMIRITSSSSSSGSNEGHESTIVSRIERVLQVNHTTAGGFSGRDERLSGVVGGDHHGNSWNDAPQQSSSNSSNRFTRYNVRYFIPQEAVDELETILKTFRDRIEQTHKRKKKKQHADKAKIFEDALDWIKANRNKKFPGSGRCEVLPKLEAVVEAPSKTKNQQQQQQQQSKESSSDESPAEIIIGASEAVLRHIARDDGREDPNTNQRIPKKQHQGQTFSRTYIVASQEEDLLDDLRMLGTVPILRCANNASVLILENPSKKGQRSDSAKEQSKWKGALQNPAEKALVDAAWEAQKKTKVRITGLETDQQQKRGQSTKAKGPNPLSCKRRRSENQPTKSGESKSKKRRARAQRNKEAAAQSSAAAASPKE